MTSKDINNLVINKVENQEVYDYMVENNLINENELYLVQGDNLDNEIDDKLKDFYTSEQVDDLLSDKLDKNVINDNISTTTTVYSSNKVNTLIENNETSVINTINNSLGNQLSTHTSDKNNPHEVNAEQIGLGNVDNTSDMNKPISTAQRNAIDNAVSTANSYTDTKVANLVGAAPETLNTLEEVARAIEDNEDVVSALNDAIGSKASQSDLESLQNVVNNKASQDDLTTLQNNINNTIDSKISTHTSDKNNPHEVNAEQIGLGNVDNTSDINKPISNATQQALNELDNKISNIYTSEQIDNLLNEKLDVDVINDEESSTTSVYSSNKIENLISNIGGGSGTSIILENNNEVKLKSFSGISNSTNYKYEECENLPYDFYQGCAVVYNNEIHILGSYTSSYRKYHYKFDGTTWTQLEDLPYNFYQGCAVVYNDEIHILGSYSSSYYKYHYKFDGTTWTQLEDLPYDFYQGCAIVYDNEIHIMGSYASSSYYKYHYKFNGTTWTQLEDLPYDFYGGHAVVYNDEIHTLGSYSTSYRNYHYKFDKLTSTWTQLEDLPYDFYQSSAVVYNDEIHMLGSYNSSYTKKGCKFDGNVYSKLEDLPYDFYQGSAVVYNNEIYILGGYQTRKFCYKYTRDVVNSNDIEITSINLENEKTIPFKLPYAISDNSNEKITLNHFNINSNYNPSWEELENLPYDFYQGCAIVYDNEIHIMGSYASSYRKYHYKFDKSTSTWIKLNDLPYDFYQACAVVYNDEIHILGSYASSYRKYHYKFDGTTWTEVSTLPYDFYGGNAVVYNDEIHMLGSYASSYYKYHYKFDKLTSTWTQLEDLPYNFYQGCAVVYNNEIHILGSYSYSYYKYHYKFDGSAWTEVSTLPYDFYQGSAVVYGNNLFIVGGYSDESVRKFYKFNRKWERLNDLPYNKYQSCAIVYEKKLQLLGGDGDSSRYKLYYEYELDEFKNASLNGMNINDNVDIPIIFSTNIFLKNKTIEDFKWDKLETIFSKYFYQAEIVNFNDEIHILGDVSNGGTNHYKWDGENWYDIGTLPYTFTKTSVMVYKNELHMLGGNDGTSEKYHYKFDGSTWTEVSTLPTSNSGLLSIVHDDYIYLFNYNSTTTICYKFNGSTWETCTIVNDNKNFRTCTFVVYNGKIHIIGEINGVYKHCVVNNISNNSIEIIELSQLDISTVPVGGHPIKAIVYNNKIHCYYYPDYYNLCCIIYNGSTWYKKYDNIITINSNSHYPFIFNDKLNIFTTSGFYSNRSHFVFRESIYDVYETYGLKNQLINISKDSMNMSSNISKTQNGYLVTSEGIVEIAVLNEQSDSCINDITSSNQTTYSSEKIDGLINELREIINSINA